MTTSPSVASLVATMTLEQKVAQLTCIARTSEAEWLRGPDGAPSVDAILERHRHGVGQLGRPSQKLPPEVASAFTAALQASLADRAPGIGALFNEEGVHGHMAAGGTHFPAAIALASSWDPELVEEVYSAVAAEVRARGSNYVYAPVLDLARDPRWGRVEETFGEDPHLVSALGVAAIRGLQGGGWGIPADKVLACAKHLVAHGAPEGGRNAAPVHMGRRELLGTHLRPFRAAADAGVGAMMLAYHDIDGIPCHIDAWLLGDVLRDRWRWEGMASSDGFGVPQLATVHGVATDPADAARQAISAGLDAEVPEGVGFPHLVDLVRSGDVDESIIDRAVARVLTAKERLGLLEPGDRPASPPLSVVNSTAHRAIALRAAHRAAVLLTNDPVDGRRLLPLPSGIGSIAVVGPNADAVHLGGYSDDPGVGTSVLDGMRERFGADRVRHAIGCRISEATGAGAWWDDDSVPVDPASQDGPIEEAVGVAAASEVAVLVIGGDESTAREAWTTDRRGDRASLDLPGRQVDLLYAVAATGTPMIAVVMGGRPLDLGPVVDTCGAILQVWYPGQEGGQAIAGLLAGDVAPTGRLPITMPGAAGTLPRHSGLAASSRRRYLGDDPGPHFPFGHGLTYTDFDISTPTAAPSTIPPDGIAAVTATVANVGGREGETVIQCYVTDRVASVARPHRRLVGFQRLVLGPGAPATVTFEIGLDALALLDRDLVERVEPGVFDIWVGFDAETRNGATLTVS